ncbi:DUF2993 domain-containing protein [Streptomyces sp. NPDC057686]|uniref:LmeA family phospholipid-binding protein n=1 Tax=Streptomyces sp. NPDC057686 TaxID=3346212 RepID=UPI0036C388E9
MPLRSPHTPTTAKSRTVRTASPRRRAPRAVAVALLVGAALLTADAVARQVAENRFADRIAARPGGGLASPEVTIEGYPFLLDAARGTHPEVRVRGDARTSDGIPVKASVDLHAVSEHAGGYAAQSLDAAFTAPFASLGSRGDRSVRLSDAGNGRVRIEAAVVGMPLVITAEPRLDAGAVTLSADSASLAGRPIDPATPAIGRALSERSRPIPPLPLGLEPTAVSVGSGGVTVHARARRTDLT